MIPAEVQNGHFGLNSGDFGSFHLRGDRHQRQMAPERVYGTSLLGTLYKEHGGNPPEDKGRIRQPYQKAIARDAEEVEAEARELYERLLKSREPVKPTVLEEAMQKKDVEFSVVESEVRDQQRTIDQLSSDVKACLEFFIQTNIDANDGPYKNMPQRLYLPKPVIKHLGLSEKGERVLEVLKVFYL